MSQEQVNHPQHYGGADNPYEAIRVIENWNLGFCLGNVVKYISRAGKKDAGKTLEDLRKSRWYLDREIQNLEKAAAMQQGVWDLKELLNTPIYNEGIKRPRPFSEGKLGPTIHPSGGLLIGNVPDNCLGDGLTVYCSGSTNSKLEEPGATNRLKPVEDKAEVQETVWGKVVAEVLEEALERDRKSLVPEEDNAKWPAATLDEAFAYNSGEPLIQHTTGDSILAGLERLKETEIRIANVLVGSGTINEDSLKALKKPHKWLDEAY